MSTALVGGIIAGVGALTSGIIGAVSQKSANDTNRQIADEQMAYQTSEREASQAYNTPEAQRKRFEQAGINPYLALGQMDAGSTQAQASSGLAQVQPVDYSGIFQGLNAGMDTYNQFQQTESMQLGIERDKVDTRFKLAEKILNISEQRQRILNSSMDYKVKQAELGRLDTLQKQMESDLEFTRQTFDDRKAAIKKQNKLMDLDAKAKDLQNDYQQLVNDMQPIQRKILERTVSEINSRIDFNKSASANQAANAAVAVMEEQLKKAEKEGVKLDNFHKARLNPIIRDTAKQQFKSRKWDADHPSYFDKLVGSVQSMNKATGLETNQPKGTPQPMLREEWQP